MWLRRLDWGIGGFKAIKQERPLWPGGIAVGRYDFVESVQLELGYSAIGRSIVDIGGSSVLREDETGYDVILT